MFTSDLRLVICTFNLQVGHMENTGRTFEKALLNWLPIIFYMTMCKPTLVTTSRANVICNCHCLY